MNQKGHGKAGNFFFGFFLGVQGSNSLGPGVLVISFLLCPCSTCSAIRVNLVGLMTDLDVSDSKI